jgi:hypothetical protein
MLRRERVGIIREMVNVYSICPFRYNLSIRNLVRGLSVRTLG